MGLGHAVAAPPSSQAEPRRAAAQSHSSVVISRQDEAVGSQATACGPLFPRLMSPRDGGGHMSVGDRNGIWEMGGRWVDSDGRLPPPTPTTRRRVLVSGISTGRSSGGAVLPLSSLPSHWESPGTRVSSLVTVGPPCFLPSESVPPASHPGFRPAGVYTRARCSTICVTEHERALGAVTQLICFVSSALQVRTVWPA